MTTEKKRRCFGCKICYIILCIVGAGITKHNMNAVPYYYFCVDTNILNKIMLNMLITAQYFTRRMHITF